MLLGDSTYVNANLTNTTLRENDIGLYAHYADNVALSNCVVDSNSTYGIHCEYSDVSIKGSTIQYNDIGIYCDYSSHATISDNTIKHQSSAAIKCDHGSCPAIEWNLITDNQGGIFAMNNANPDIGHSSGGS
jgi:parallel beta-helix repeat protein